MALYGVEPWIRRGEAFSSDESPQLLSLAVQVAAALQMAGLHERLREQAQTDGLTGLANRRHFQDRLSAEANRSRRHGTPLALVLLDVDHFKQVNVRYGHHAGDLVLQHVASVVQDSCRPYGQQSGSALHVPLGSRTRRGAADPTRPGVLPRIDRASPRRARRPVARLGDLPGAVIRKSS